MLDKFLGGVGPGKGGKGQFLRGGVGGRVFGTVDNEG